MMMMVMMRMVLVVVLLLLQVVKLILRRGARGWPGRGQIVRFYHYDRGRRSIVLVSGKMQMVVRMVRMVQVRMVMV